MNPVMILRNYLYYSIPYTCLVYSYVFYITCSTMFDIEAIKDAPKEHCAPYIDVKPQPVEVDEGDNAKYLARVSGYPRPKITWRINDTVVVTVSMIHHLYSR